MKRLFMLTVFGLTLVFASNSFAAGYGAAGCGWGGRVIQENQKLHQLGASILNGVFSNNTFAMSSGTSGCTKAGLASAENDQKNFVESNYKDLAKEMAVGKGEHLATLSTLLGCPSDQDSNFGAFAKRHYATIIKSEDTTPAEMLVALKDSLSDNPAFNSSCQKI